MQFLSTSKTRIIIICIIIITLIPIGLSISNNERQKVYDIYLKQGNEYLKNKYYNNAIISYQKAIITDSRKDTPYLKLAEIYTLKNNSQNAELILEEGIKNIKDKDNLYLSLGDLLFNQRKYNEAIGIYFQISNEVIERPYKIAEAYYQLNQRAQALAILNEVSENNISNEYFYLKSLFYLFSDSKEALRILKTVNFTGDLEVKTLTLKSLLKNEDSEYNKLLLAKEIIVQGFPIITINPLQQIISQNPKYRDAYLILGKAYFDNNELSKAETNWQKAIEIDLTYGETYFLLSQLYYTQNNLQNAKNEVEKAILLEPTNYRFYSFIAQIYDKQQNCDLKIQSQEKTVNELTLWQNSQTILDNQILLTKYYLDCNETTKSLVLTENLNNSNLTMEKEKIVKDLYLWTKWQKEKDSNILSLYQNYLQKFPDSASGHYHYGKLLEEQGNLTESKKEIERAYELEEPNNAI